MLFCHLLSHCFRNPSFVFQVNLIPDEDPHNILRGVFINVPQPICHIVQAFLVGDVVDKHDTHSLPVETGGDGVEPFLAGSVPNLQLHHLSINLYCVNLEINANCRDERVVESILAKPEYDASLADARVTNEEQLEKVVKAFARACLCHLHRSEQQLNHQKLCCCPSEVYAGMLRLVLSTVAQ